MPPEYRDLYENLAGDLDAFEARVDARWDGTPGSTRFSAGLLPANPNLGEALLRPETLPAVRLFLDRFQAMGLSGVAIDINYPLLTPRFHADPATQQAYLDFYKQVAREARQRGLAVAVEQQVVFPDYSTLPVRDYYAALTFEQFRQEFLEMARLILIEIRPDYLSLGNEPDTAAYNTGLPLDDLDTYVAMLNFLLAGLDEETVGQTQLGAGFGTWMPDAETWARRFTGETDIDYLNLHIYPVDLGLMERALDLADIASDNGTRVAVHEAWLYKWQRGDTRGVAMAENIFARDAYDFWQPLDQQFIRAMVKFAHAYDLAYLSFFWSNYFFAYLDYDEVRDLSVAQVRREANRAAMQAVLEGTLGPTGTYYREVIQSPPR